MRIQRKSRLTPTTLQPPLLLLLQTDGCPGGLRSALLGFRVPSSLGSNALPSQPVSRNLCAAHTSQAGTHGRAGPAYVQCRRSGEVSFRHQRRASSFSRSFPAFLAFSRFLSTCTSYPPTTHSFDVYVAQRLTFNLADTFVVADARLFLPSSALSHCATPSVRLQRRSTPSVALPGRVAALPQRTGALK
jgi:hypothetical protein